ncbi:RagB/SusD family nutrient uptake outer membrane protein [Muribaculum intestinale]|uniref:RagB/SusD family nutrient uptake outer membrane protein n=2 Tax=Muribaculum intestinale TaxID=1796646 RepID=A0A1B1SB91_9BACT|nr:RagB/SusD family nutrient uptake outer membrane protein [Muribaculum intestinale]ANU64079.1 RagB/SusD family nutrient uptake outer membrane protein [Muribaculum intestinale]ASB37825.1 RagB/SusD family nutrient uptake outer membrane protein [Muribaculum intestinale]PWB05696.1 RagB/SusD family nutrient uptake outer membrane protein [Muribaculum intestinale]QQR08557.1 RagB/SusD family nutrient uptake outer membrane protein [Muribaculum intestinale]
MNLKRFIYLGALALSLSACESQLEIDPISDISNANYWQSSSDVEGYLTGTYSNFRSLIDRVTYGEDRGDALQPGSRGGVSRAHTQRLDNENGYDWKVIFTNLHHVNMIIKNTAAISFSDQNAKNRILAQAYTMRAHDYMLLLQMWGDAPIVLNPTETADKSTKPSRQPKEAVMAQVLSDLETALSLFPESSIPNKYRISRPSALMLKAEALAWNYTVLKSGDKQNLTDAIACLDEVEQCGVKLVDNYADIFDVSHRLNSEIIFAIYVRFGEYDSMYALNFTESAVQGQVGSAVNKDQIPYSNGNIAAPYYAPSAKIKAAFTSADKRKPVCFIEGINKDGKVLFTCQNKFRGTPYEKDRYYDNDIVVYRLADAHLLKAELLCYLGGGNVPTAVSLMNKTRNRAGIGDYSGPTDQTSVQRAILDERFLELCFELKRWPDLMRAHGAGTINVYNEVPNLNGKSTPLYFPITLNMRDYNENLTQTEGY